MAHQLKYSADIQLSSHLASQNHGDLTGVLGEYWSVEANLKARTFWAHRQCPDQLANVCEEYGMEVTVLSEAWISQTCPECDERE